MLPGAFKEARPEFRQLTDATITAALAEAELQVTQTGEWGALRPVAVSLLASHLLWDSPYGATLRLEGGEQEKSSRYLRQYRELSRKILPHHFIT